MTTIYCINILDPCIYYQMEEFEMEDDTENTTSITSCIVIIGLMAAVFYQLVHLSKKVSQFFSTIWGLPFDTVFSVVSGIACYGFIFACGIIPLDRPPTFRLFEPSVWFQPEERYIPLDEWAQDLKANALANHEIDVNDTTMPSGIDANAGNLNSAVSMSIEVGDGGEIYGVWKY